MPEAPLAELRVRVTGLGEWGTRIAELLGDSGLEARAIDSSASVRRTGLDPAASTTCRSRAGRRGAGRPCPARCPPTPISRPGSRPTRTATS